MSDGAAIDDGAGVRVSAVAAAAAVVGDDDAGDRWLRC